MESFSTYTSGSEQYEIRLVVSSGSVMLLLSREEFPLQEPVPVLLLG